MVLESDGTGRFELVCKDAVSRFGCVFTQEEAGLIPLGGRLEPNEWCLRPAGGNYLRTTTTVMSSCAGSPPANSSASARRDEATTWALWSRSADASL